MSRYKIRTSTTLLAYFLKLKVGEINGRVYKKIEKKSSQEIDKFIEFNDVLDNHIRESLYKLKVGNIFDISANKGFENVGVGCIITSALFGNLIAISQKEAYFYFTTDLNKKTIIKLELRSIPRISGKIKFEDIIIEAFSMSTLSKYTTSLEITSELVNKKLSRVSIIVDRCWSPKYLDNSLPDFPLGIGIKSIEVIQR